MRLMQYTYLCVKNVCGADAQLIVKGGAVLPCIVHDLPQTRMLHQGFDVHLYSRLIVSCAGDKVKKEACCICSYLRTGKPPSQGI